MATPEAIKVYRPPRRSSSRHFVQEALEPLAEDAVSLFERSEAGLEVHYLHAVIDELELSTTTLARLLKISPSTLTRRLRAGKGGVLRTPSRACILNAYGY